MTYIIYDVACINLFVITDTEMAAFVHSLNTFLFLIYSQVKENKLYMLLKHSVKLHSGKMVSNVTTISNMVAPVDSTLA